MIFESFVKSKNLKTNYLASVKGQGNLHFLYDNVADELMLMMASPETETIVHYVDSNVGLLFKPDDLEIVGIQIEGFSRSFIKKYACLEKAWKLSACEEINMKNIGEFSIYGDEKQFEFAIEVIEATKSVLGKAAQPLAKVLEYT